MKLVSVRMPKGEYDGSHCNCLARSKIGVILSPTKQFPWSWDERRVFVSRLSLVKWPTGLINVRDSLPGPPLGNHTALTTLLKSGVMIGIGAWDTSYTPGVRFDLGWVSLVLHNLWYDCAYSSVRLS